MGPRRITEVLNDWVYEVEDLVTQKKEKVHAERLKFYSESELEVTEELRNQIAHNDEKFEIDEILDIKYEEQYGRYMILIRWKNFGDDENTWEFIEEIWETTREVVKNYLKKKDSKKSIKDNALKWLHKTLKKNTT